MFRHVREVVRVLTYKPTSEEVSAAADVVFVSEPSEPPPKISLAIIAALEALVFAFIFGYLSAFLAKLVLPEKPVASVGVIGGAAVLVLRVLGDRHLHSLGAKVKLRLRIGERLAPYFGRRMERTYRVLKG